MPWLPTSKYTQFPERMLHTADPEPSKQIRINVCHQRDREKKYNLKVENKFCHKQKEVYYLDTNACITSNILGYLCNVKTYNTDNN